MALTITEVEATRTYTINGLATGDATSASVVDNTTVRLFNKVSNTTTDYKTASAFTDFTIGAANPTDANDAVAKINAITNFKRVGTSTVTTPLLLDLYPGASVAWSTGRLSSDYTGPAIEVRRSIDNATQDIGFIGENLDETSLLSFAGAGDAFVKTWYDQSGSAKNFIQNTTSRQPKIVESGSVLKKGTRPIIRHNGTTSSMATNFPVTLSGNTMTFFVSEGRNSVNNNISFLEHSTNTNNVNDGFYIYGRGLSNILVKRTSGISIANNDNWGLGHVILSLSVVRGASTDIRSYKNGIDNGTRNTSIDFSSEATKNLYLNARDNTLGLCENDTQAVVIYDNNNEANRLEIENHLKTYFSVY